MTETRTVMTAAELVDRRGKEPPFTLGSVRWRLIYAGASQDVYLGDGPGNTLWRAEMHHGTHTEYMLTSLAISYNDARNHVIECNKVQLHHGFYVQVYVGPGEAVMLYEEPERHFYLCDDNGKYTQVKEYGYSPDGKTINTVKYL